MHVVLAGQSATGHVYPLLSLADALRAAGHRVSFATTADLVPWLNELGYRASPVGQTIQWALAQVQARSPELTSDLPPGKAWRLDAELFADALPRSTTPDLVELLSALQPDLVVYESTAFGAVLAAAEVGIPVVCLDLWAVGHWHVDRGELEGRVRAVWADRTVAPLRVDPISGMAHLDPAPAALRTADDHDPTRLEMQQVCWGDPALSLSPWVSSERSRPLVYLTLGTVGWGTVGVLQECLSGLSALPVDVLVAVGAYFDPADLGPLPASVHVERFVRQDLLLGEVTIAVHHGGSGTLLGAAAHGIPPAGHAYGSRPVSERRGACPQWRRARAVARRRNCSDGPLWGTRAARRTEISHLGRRAPERNPGHADARGHDSAIGRAGTVTGLG